MAKVLINATYGDLYVVSKSLTDKLANGTYMFNCTCIRCGAEQKRAHQNLLTSQHPRCNFCSGVTTKAAALKKAKGLDPGTGVIVAFRKDSTYLAVSGSTIPQALDNLPAAAMLWSTQETPEMAVMEDGQKAEALKGLNHQRLQEVYALRQVFAGAMSGAVDYDLPKLVRTPASLNLPDPIPGDAMQETIASVAPKEFEPLREEYMTVASGHFKFFDHERESPKGEELPPYMVKLAEEFEEKYGDITEYTFSSSPAPAGQVFVYWQKPQARTLPPMEKIEVPFDPTQILTTEEEEELVSSRFSWRENAILRDKLVEEMKGEKS